MERPYVSTNLRNLVANRANYCCEYCLIREQDTAFGCAVDHIISLKHGGTTAQDNLAYACVFCNRFKGSDIGSIIWETKEFIRFYHPRWDCWEEHFTLESSLIQPITKIGQVTAKILRFNKVDRVTERLLLIHQNLYPPTRG